MYKLAVAILLLSAPAFAQDKSEYKPMAMDVAGRFDPLVDNSHGSTSRTLMAI
jgi:hypothetical protein